MYSLPMTISSWMSAKISKPFWDSIGADASHDPKILRFNSLSWIVEQLPKTDGQYPKNSSMPA
jgi:hypothetical protein